MNLFYIFFLFFNLVFCNIDSAPYELMLIFSIYQQEDALDWLNDCKMFQSNQYEYLSELDDDLLKLKYIIQITQTLNLENVLDSLKGTDINSLIDFFTENGGENKIKAGFIASTIFTNIPDLGNNNSNYATKLNFLMQEIFSMKSNFDASNLSILENSFDYLKQINIIRNKDFLESITEEGKNALSSIGISIVNDALVLSDPSVSSLENSIQQSRTLSKSDFGDLKPKTHIENILHINRLISISKNYGC